MPLNVFATPVVSTVNFAGVGEPPVVATEKVMPAVGLPRSTPPTLLALMPVMTPEAMLAPAPNRSCTLLVDRVEVSVLVMLSAARTALNAESAAW